MEVSTAPGRVTTALADAESLTAFAKGSLVPSGGFGHLDAFGRVDPGQPVHTYITARMTYVFSLASLLEFPDVERYARHGVAALRGLLRDTEHGGFYAGGTNAPTRKEAYTHCFVALAAATASAAGVPGADSLLTHAAESLEEHFWSERDGVLLESWDRAFREPEEYRGANSNMHGVEAMLALHHATGDRRWLDRAISVARTFIDQHARSADWLLPEHYTLDWQPLRDYNRHQVSDLFRPCGVTIGHLFEWSRLLVELDYAADGAETWIPAAATSLYATARRLGWAVDGADGFLYTVDWDETPLIRERLHWVCAEAIGAAVTLLALNGFESTAAAESCRSDLATWTAFAAGHLVDPEHGSWHHELDPSNRPSARLWSGKPDVYHAFQATLVPMLPLRSTFAARIAALRTVGP